MRAAAEAVIELLGGTYGKGRRFLAVEGTKPQIVGAALLELHRAGDDLYDVYPIEQVLLEGVRYHEKIGVRARFRGKALRTCCCSTRWRF
jgi:hypothetical protein